MICADAFARDAPNLVADSKALQRVLSREVARWRQHVPDDERRQRIENLVALATLVGRIAPRAGSFSFLATGKVADLLPNPDLLESNEYNGIAGAPSMDATIGGLQPDLLGERFVLDRLTADGRIGQVTQRLLQEAWALQPHDVCDFVLRAAADYPGDPGLALVHGLSLDSAEARSAWSELTADLVRVADAFVEWSDVIAMAEASDEARACALNNPADVFARRGAHAESVRDRSMVLALRETSYNRRYIAQSRRSRSLAVLGRTDEALDDLKMVLLTGDIAPKQKANAALDRGVLLTGLGRYVEARQDFDAVLASDEVFGGTHAYALVKLAELCRLERDAKQAHEYLDAAMTSSDADEQVFIEALLVGARLLADAGDSIGAESIWLSVLANPNSSARQKAVAERRGSNS